MKRPRQCRGLFLAAALNFAVEEPLSRFVIPAKAVIQRLQAFKTKALDYRLRWNDGRMELLGTPEDVTHADFAPAPHPACHSSFSPQAARRKSDKDSPRTGSRSLIRMQIKTPAYAGAFIVGGGTLPAYCVGLAFWLAIHWSTRRSSKVSGKAPPPSTLSWKPLMSNLSPSSASAFLRSSWMRIMPIL